MRACFFAAVTHRRVLIGVIAAAQEDRNKRREREGAAALVGSGRASRGKAPDAAEVTDRVGRDPRRPFHRRAGTQGQGAEELEEKRKKMREIKGDKTIAEV